MRALEATPPGGGSAEPTRWSPGKIAKYSSARRRIPLAMRDVESLNLREVLRFS